MQSQDRNETHARGQNKLFQNASLLMCNFVTGYVLTLKTDQSVRHVIGSMFKLQISLDHATSNTN